MGDYVGIIRLSIIGNQNGGRHTLVNSFFSNNNNTNYPFDFNIKNYTINNEKLKIYIYISSPSLINYHTIFHLSNYILLILDMTDISNSLTSITNILPFVNKYRNKNSNLILVQTKCDLCNHNDYILYSENIINLCVNNNISMYQTNINEINTIENLFISIINEYYQNYL